MGRTSRARQSLGENFRKKGAHAVQVPLFPSVLFSVSPQPSLLQLEAPDCSLLFKSLIPGYQVTSGSTHIWL